MGSSLTWNLWTNAIQRKWKYTWRLFKLSCNWTRWRRWWTSKMNIIKSCSSCWIKSSSCKACHWWHIWHFSRSSINSSNSSSCLAKTCIQSFRWYFWYTFCIDSFPSRTSLANANFKSFRWYFWNERTKATLSSIEPTSSCSSDLQSLRNKSLCSIALKSPWLNIWRRNEYGTKRSINYCSWRCSNKSWFQADLRYQSINS